MMNSIVTGIAVVPSVLGIVQVCKIAGLPGRLAPLLSLILGIAAAIGLQFAYQSMNWPDLVQAVFVGISYGLSASGIYAGAQTIRPVVNGPTTPPAGPPAAV